MFEAKQFDSINGVPGLSEKLMTEHYKLYEGYVKKANEIEEKLKTVDLSTANATQSDLRALKLGYSFAVDAIKAHELYFGHLGGGSGKPTGHMGKLIEKNFGSFEQWDADMRATGIAARGWVWTAYDWDRGTLFNYLGDAHDAFPIWGATPLVALDVYEHAYMIDYGVNRKDYIESFMKTLDWDVIEKRITDLRIDQMAGL
jgi:superoxide dismutase, Fe-Mn family